MNKAKKIIKSWRVILLVVFVVFSIWFIKPNFDNEGAAIRFVIKNSSAADAGIHSPLETDRPMMYEIVTDINGQKVRNIEDFSTITKDLEVGDSVRIKTKSLFTYNSRNDRTKSAFGRSDKNYVLTVKPILETIVLNETENRTFEKVIAVNETINNSLVEVNKTINYTKEVAKTIQREIGIEDIGLRVQDAPKTNLIKGLDLQGGTRVMLKPAEGENVSDDDLDMVISSLKERLDVYGLANIPIRTMSDLLGNKFIIIEIAGINEEEIKDLLSKQGKFEAKIGNETVFIGGQDITYVCRSADCSYAVDPRRPCGLIGGGMYQCSFMFSITISHESAERFAEITDKLDIVSDEAGDYLSEKLLLYLDDEMVDELSIVADLKGKAETGISITGSGVGESQQAAVMDSAKNMKKLQTILKTGSLPVKLDIVKIDTVSPILGEQFVKNALLVGLSAMLAVAFIVFIRYREIKVALPMVLTMISEVVMLLGFAALAGWNLDLAAIAGIIVAVGTGVDHLIVITDETAKKGGAVMNWKERIKRAFYIITAAYFTTLVAMLPLWSAGAGLLRGFALTTIAGITLGVFIARPAYGAVIEILLKD